MQIVQIAPINTTDATPTVLWTKLSVPINTAFSIAGRVEGRKSDRSATFTAWFQAEFRRGASGALVLVGSTITPLEDSAGTPAVTITVSSNDARINVTGIAAETWNWKAQDITLTRF